ncbi:hypothetical protein GCM10027451_21530 [Geodermatophilus aquaeductus]|uniref:Uncharacterized protein n=1 Tax=Geodermatophilus aquaeductus TaxID=1564161 RepID=A0A521AQV8_9ACTN|nr:hypothetical protein [Geodermatophilus aquaeductus]SMO37175.1 hypothetical protein SAMN06273567_101281 [Geodermatophilus aquaeductus]
MAVVLLVVALVVVVLVMRATVVAGRGLRRPQPPTAGPRPADPVRPVAPDDDPEFLRELARRVRRDDSPA